MVDAFYATPLRSIMLCAIATIISFCALAMQEIIAVNATKQGRVALRLPILAGTVGNAISNILGFHAITITAWRYRVYTKAGFSIADIASISGFIIIGMALGYSSVTAVSLLLNPATITVFSKQYSVYILGLILIIILCMIIGLSTTRKELKCRKFLFSLPDRTILTKQLAIGLVEMFAAVYACYSLLPISVAPEFVYFALIYVAVTLLGVASNTPGGIGVFEAGMMSALGAVGNAQILTALLLYRIIYNLIPFAIACTIIAIYELKQRIAR